MVNVGIHYGDTLVVNRALIAFHDDFVVATIYGEQTVKELHTKQRVIDDTQQSIQTDLY